ncbi:MAG TPA: hypothetical protein VJM33_01085 [Microthrixaceae bacterium]|nr:hypothetical protein [Microthrixaceae bacterium]
MQRRFFRVAACAFVLTTLMGCLAPSLRTTEPKRVLIVADSVFHGSTVVSYPALEPVLGEELAAAGIELRALGTAGSRPARDRWVQTVKQTVDEWNPDLVIFESAIPDDVEGKPRFGLVATWALLYVAAARHGADVWRVEPPTPVPGSFIDAFHGPRLAQLRSAQADGARIGAENRPTTVELGPVLASCDSPWTPDGGHLTVSGMWCVSDDLFRRIARREPRPRAPSDDSTTTTAP